MSQLAVIEHQLQPLRPMFDQLLRPTGVPAERIIRSVLISCERTPRLLECTPLSVIQAATTGAVLGLEADGHTGQGFLVPFRQKGTLKAQWLTGYKGFSTLAARVGLTVNGEVVREGDFIDFELGSSGFVRHKPMIGGGANRRIIGAWATASAPGRDPIVVWLDIDDILAVKQRSQAAKRQAGEGEEGFSPWNDPAVGFPAMAAKTAKRRLSRGLPLSVYLSAARVDEAHEEQGHHAYLHPEKGIVIDGTPAPAPAAQPKGLPVEALEPRRFVIRRNRGEGFCATIDARQQNPGLRQDRPGESQPRPQTAPRGATAEIEPAKVRGGFDWRGYASRVLEEFRALAPADRPAFRTAQARYLTLLRQANREASTDLAMAMADVDRVKQ